MALAVTKIQKYVELKNVYGTFSVVPSGNYVPGGEVLGLKAIFGVHKDPFHVALNGKAGFLYSYDYATDKLMVFTNAAGGVNLALVEHTAVAYVAGILADVIRGYVVFPKA